MQEGKVQISVALTRSVKRPIIKFNEWFISVGSYLTELNGIKRKVKYE